MIKPIYDMQKYFKENIYDPNKEIKSGVDMTRAHYFNEVGFPILNIFAEYEGAFLDRDRPMYTAEWQIFAGGLPSFGTWHHRSLVISFEAGITLDEIDAVLNWFRRSGFVSYPELQKWLDEKIKDYYAKISEAEKDTNTNTDGGN